MNDRFLSINLSKMVSYNHVGDCKQRQLGKLLLFLSSAYQVIYIYNLILLKVIKSEQNIT